VPCGRLVSLALLGLGACSRPEAPVAPRETAPPLEPPSLSIRSPATFVSPLAVSRGAVVVRVVAERAATVRCNEAPLQPQGPGRFEGPVPVSAGPESLVLTCEALGPSGLGARDTRTVRAVSERFSVGMTPEPGAWRVERTDDDDLLVAVGDGAVRFSPEGKERWAHAPKGVTVGAVSTADGGALLRVVGGGADGRGAVVLRVNARGSAEALPSAAAGWPLALVRLDEAAFLVERRASSTALVRLAVDASAAPGARREVTLPFEPARTFTRDGAVALEGPGSTLLYSQGLEPVESGIAPVAAAPTVSVQGHEVLASSGARRTFTRPVHGAYVVGSAVVVLLAPAKGEAPAIATLTLPGLAILEPETARPELARWVDAQPTDEGVLALGVQARAPDRGLLFYRVP
jgi:hypothetical protein